MEKLAGRRGATGGKRQGANVRRLEESGDKVIAMGRGRKEILTGQKEERKPRLAEEKSKTSHLKTGRGKRIDGEKNEKQELREKK